MVRERLGRSDAKAGFLLDGFPRTQPQAEALADIMDDLNEQIEAVLCLNVPDEEIIERVCGRRLCPVCQASYHVTFKQPKVENHCDVDGAELYQRADDTIPTVKARLNIYHGQTMPVINYYREQGLLREVSGSGAVAEVDDRLLALVQSREFQQKLQAVS
jgi:adenylate kinase